MNTRAPFSSPRYSNRRATPRNSDSPRAIAFALTPDRCALAAAASALETLKLPMTDSDALQSSVPKA